MGFCFSPKFEPVLMPNETATLMGAAFPKDGQPILCLANGALPEYQKDFGTVTAAQWLSDQEDSNLEMGTGELAQFRMAILDDFKLELKNPAPQDQWRTAATTFYLPKFPTDPNEDWFKELLFAMSEFFVYEDDTPRFNLYSEFGLTISRVLFRGWRFKVRTITKAELTSKQVIWVGSWPASK